MNALVLGSSVQLQPERAQRGGRERRWVQRLQNSEGIHGAQVRQGPRHSEEGTQLLHLQLRWPLPGWHEDCCHCCLSPGDINVIDIKY